MLAFASEIPVERGGAAGRTIGYCLHAAAELGRFFEREDRQKSGSLATRKRSSAKVCRRSSKTEAGSRKKRKIAQRKFGSARLCSRTEGSPGVNGALRKAGQMMSTTLTKLDLDQLCVATMSYRRNPASPFGASQDTHGHVTDDVLPVFYSLHLAGLAGAQERRDGNCCAF